MFEAIAIFFILLISSIFLTAAIHESANTDKYHGFKKGQLRKMKGYKVLWGR